MFLHGPCSFSDQFSFHFSFPLLRVALLHESYGSSSLMQKVGYRLGAGGRAPPHPPRHFLGLRRRLRRAEGEKISAKSEKDDITYGSMHPEG